MDEGVGSLAGAAAEAAAEPSVRQRRAGWLTAYKKRGDKRQQIDLAELPEAMRGLVGRSRAAAGGERP